MDIGQVIRASRTLAAITGLEGDWTALSEDPNVTAGDIADLLQEIAREISPADRDIDTRVVDLHAEGRNDVQISDRIGVSAEKVRRIRRRLGLPGHKRIPSSGWQEALTRAWYQQLTNTEIAAELGWTLKTVRARLSLLRLPSRKTKVPPTAIPETVVSGIQVN